MRPWTRIVDRPCEWCGKMYRPDRPERRFCSIPCVAKRNAHAAKMKRTANCAACGAEFESKHKKQANGDRKWTQTCGRACTGKLMDRGGRPASQRRRRYGIEPADYDRLAEKGCALCGAFPQYALYVDHDHESGRVRGVLCQRCNVMAATFDRLNPAGIHRFWDYCHPGEPLRVREDSAEWSPH